MTTLLMWVALILTCGYTSLNGFRDASTAIAAAVRTRALTPVMAVSVAALFSFLGTMLSTTFGMYLINQLKPTLPDGRHGLMLLISALLAAGGWGLYCWWRGVPMSSTHALISSVVGVNAAAAIIGDASITSSLMLLWAGVLLPLLLTSVIAYFSAFLLVAPVTWFTRHDSAQTVHSRSRAGQSVAACAVALGLGLQDGQRSGALMTLILLLAGSTGTVEIGFTTQLAAASFLALGVLCGGWRIVHTIGHRLVKFDPLRGMVAQSVASIMLYAGALLLHLPLSTTQAVTGAVVGAGANQSFETVAWRNVVRVGAMWVATPVVCILLAATLALAASPLV